MVSVLKYKLYLMRVKKFSINIIIMNKALIIFCFFTCLKISSSSRLLLSSTCRLPLSSASRILLCRSANMENAWTLRSSCSRISSLLRKSTILPRVAPSKSLSASSTNDSCQQNAYIYSEILPSFKHSFVCQTSR